MPHGRATSPTTIPGSLYARAVMLDASGAVARADPSDHNHALATIGLEDVAKAGLPLFVTVPVVHEAQRLVLHRRGERDAAALVQALIDASVNLVWPDRADLDSAVALIERYRGLPLSLTDATTMVVMLRIGIVTAFTFDSDFEIVGFRHLP